MVLSNHNVFYHYNSVIMIFCLFLKFLAPNVSVQVNDSGATPTAGQNYLLTCSVSGAENLNPTTIPTDGLGTVAVVRLKLGPTQTLSHSLHYDWLMLLVMFVEL
jgi:hypothetical protein